MEKIAGQVTEDVSVPSQADILSEIGRSTEEKHVKEACKGSTERKHGKEARKGSTEDITEDTTVRKRE